MQRKNRSPQPPARPRLEAALRWAASSWLPGEEDLDLFFHEQTATPGRIFKFLNVRTLKVIPERCAGGEILRMQLSNPIKRETVEPDPPFAKRIMQTAA